MLYYLRPKCVRFQVGLVGPRCSSTYPQFRLVPATNDADDVSVDVSDFTVTTSGQICVAAPLDFESKSQYHFYVVSDNNNSSDTGKIQT